MVFFFSLAGLFHEVELGAGLHVGGGGLFVAVACKIRRGLLVEDGAERVILVFQQRLLVQQRVKLRRVLRRDVAQAVIALAVDQKRRRALGVPAGGSSACAGAFCVSCEQPASPTSSASSIQSMPPLHTAPPISAAAPNDDLHDLNYKVAGTEVKPRVGAGALRFRVRLEIHRVKVDIRPVELEKARERAQPPKAVPLIRRMARALLLRTSRFSCSKPFSRAKAKIASISAPAAPLMLQHEAPYTGLSCKDRQAVFCILQGAFYC